MSTFTMFHVSSPSLSRDKNVYVSGQGRRRRRRNDQGCMIIEQSILKGGVLTRICSLAPHAKPCQGDSTSLSQKDISAANPQIL